MRGGIEDPSLLAGVRVLCSFDLSVFVLYVLCGVRPSGDNHFKKSLTLMKCCRTKTKYPGRVPPMAENPSLSELRLWQAAPRIPGGGRNAVPSPFVRQSRLKMSPVKTTADVNLVWDETGGQSVKKRRRMDEGRQEQEGTDARALLRMLTALKKLRSEGIVMTKEVVKNTKQELRGAVGRVAGIITSVTEPGMLRALEELVSEINKDCGVCAKEVETKEVETREMSTQTCDQDEELNKLMGVLKDERKSFEDFKEVNGMSVWPREAYECMKREVCDGRGMGAKRNVICVVSEDGVEGCMEEATIAGKEGVVGRLLKASEEKAGVLCYVRKEWSGLVLGGQNVGGERDEKPEVEGVVRIRKGVYEEEDLYEGMKSMVVSMSGISVENVCVRGYGLGGPRTLERVVEYLTRGTGLKPTILARGMEVGEGVGRGGGGPGVAFKSDTLLVRPATGATYADAMRKMMKEVDVNEAGVRVMSVRKTKGGEIAIRVREQKAGGNERMKGKMIECVGDKNVKMESEKTMSVIVRDLDEMVTKEDVEKAIEAAVGRKDPAAFKVRDLMATAKGEGRWRVARVDIRKDLGAILVNRKRVRVGWMGCRVNERMNPERCYRCQEYGHKMIECKNERRERKCNRCGESGHEARGCEKDVCCYVCGVKGHRPDTMGCPKFKQVVEEMRKREWERGKR